MSDPHRPAAVAKGLLEPAGLQSRDFGAAAKEPTGMYLRGLAAPPPTTMIRIPKGRLDSKAVNLEAQAEQRSWAWRATLVRRSIGRAADWMSERAYRGSIVGRRAGRRALQISGRVLLAGAVITMLIAHGSLKLLRRAFQASRGGLGSLRAEASASYWPRAKEWAGKVLAVVAEHARHARGRLDATMKQSAVRRSPPPVTRPIAVPRPLGESPAPVQKLAEVEADSEEEAEPVADAQVISIEKVEADVEGANKHAYVSRVTDDVALRLIAQDDAPEIGTVISGRRVIVVPVRGLPSDWVCVTVPGTGDTGFIKRRFVDLTGLVADLGIESAA